MLKDKLLQSLKFPRLRLRLKLKRAQEVNLIKKSGLFDERFYISMYTDVRADAFWEKNPILHYLTHGAIEYRKPSKMFDSLWYVENNPDVEESGMNPLIHYILHGRQEGRRTHGNRYDYETRDQRELLRHTVVNHLWGGYSEPALADLERIYADNEQPADIRFFAAWHAARWYFYIGQVENMLTLAELVSDLDERFKNDKATAMMFAYGYLAQGRLKTPGESQKTFWQMFPTIQICC